MNNEYKAFKKQIITVNGQEEKVHRKGNNLQTSFGTHYHLEIVEEIVKKVFQEIEEIITNQKSEVETIKEVTDKKIDLVIEVQKYEVGLIRCALSHTKGNQRRAAKLLKVKFTTLHNKIKRYGLVQRSSDFRVV